MAYHNDLSEELNNLHVQEEVIIKSTQQSAVSILQPYISDKSLSETLAAKRKKGHNYQFFASYDTLEEAEAVIKLENMWSKKREHKPKDGTQGTYTKKIFYRCNLALYRGPQCDSAPEVVWLSCISNWDFRCYALLNLNDSSDEEVVVDLSENETKGSTNPNIINDGDTDNDAENFEPIKSTTAPKSPTKSKRGRKPKKKKQIFRKEEEDHEKICIN